MLVHAVRGRVRLRIAELRTDKAAGERIAALLRERPGVLSVRVIPACASIVVLFEPDVVSHDELAASLDRHLGPGSARTAPVTGGERFSFFSLGYTLIDPFGEVREAWVLARICQQAWRDFSRRAHPSVFFRAMLRIAIECALFDRFLPRPLRSLLRVARGFTALRRASRAPAASC